MIRGRFHQNLLLYVQLRAYCKKWDDKNGLKDGKKTLPEPPTTCCMSGCPNCVWLEYADALNEYFKDGGKSAIEEIEKHITDPSLKAYLMHELKMRNKS